MSYPVQPVIPPLGPSQHQATPHFCFMGAGYVGGITAAVMANFMWNISITVVDVDQERITAWRSDSAPFHDEPGFQDILRAVRSKNLNFSTEIDAAIARSSVIFITVDTPASTGEILELRKERDVPAPQRLDIKNIKACMERIVRVATDNKLIVIKSTVPVGTAAVFQTYVRSQAPNITLTVLSNPEFLSARTAVQDIVRPDRVVIGSAQGHEGKYGAGTLSSIYTTWISRNCIKLMTCESAELTKLASNALLAQRVSSVNTISMICERVGADIGQVAEACGLDHRIGTGMLNPSLGFGGSCLEKDTAALAVLAKSCRLPDVGSYWNSVNTVNDLVSTKVFEFVISQLSLNRGDSDKRVAVLGSGFKPGSAHLAGSRGVRLVLQLLRYGVTVMLYDSKVRQEDLRNLLNESPMYDHSFYDRLRVAPTIYRACEDANVVIIANVLDELQREVQCKVDWGKIAQDMKTPRCLVDGCRVVDKRRLRALNIKVHVIGER